MFKFLKDKLKKAVSKFTKDVDEEAEDIEETVEEPVEKPKKESPKKKAKKPEAPKKKPSTKKDTEEEETARKENENFEDDLAKLEQSVSELEKKEEDFEKEEGEFEGKLSDKVVDEKITPPGPIEEGPSEEKEIASAESEKEEETAAEEEKEEPESEEVEEEPEEELSPDLLGLKEALDEYSEEDIDSLMTILGFDAEKRSLDADSKVKEILKRPLIEINEAIEKLDSVQTEEETEADEVFEEIAEAEKKIQEKEGEKPEIYEGDEDEEKEFEPPEKTYDEEVDEESAKESKEEDVYEEYEPEELEEEERKKAEAAKPKKKGFFKRMLEKLGDHDEYDDEYPIEEKKPEKELTEREKEKKFREEEQDWYEGEEKDTRKAFEGDEEEVEVEDTEKIAPPGIDKDLMDKPKAKKEKIDEEEFEKAEEEKEEEKEVEDEPEPEEPEAEEEPEEEEPKGFFGRLKATVTSKKLSESKFEDIFFDLEVALLENNVAVEVIEKIKKDLHDRLVDKKIKRSELENTVFKTLRKSLDEILSVETIDILKKAKAKKPYIISFVGINGSGKTTTIAKMAQYFMDNGLKPVMVAGDTFRAAAIQQLEEHAKRLGVKIIKHDYGSDPAAVAFDGIKYAESKGIDVVLIDTAGRLHSNVNLMDEMKKIMRVAKPDLKIFIGESITGNDCIEQAQQFNEAVDIDGIVLSKADVDEKGGAAISVSYVTGKPILFLGTGQEYKDLQKFDKKQILANLGL